MTMKNKKSAKALVLAKARVSFAKACVLAKVRDLALVKIRDLFKKVTLTITVLSAFFICAFLAGCRKQSEQEKKLVVYSPHPVEFITELVRNFENDTGIHVEAVQKGTGEILSNLALDQDSPACDVMWGGSLSSVASAENLFEPYTTPNEEFFQSAYKNIEGVFTRFSDVPSVFMVNRNLAGNLEISGYYDLLRPELKGRIAFADPNLSSSSWEHLLNMVYATGGGDEEKGWKYVRRLCQNLDGKLLSGSKKVYEGVSDGTFVVGLTFEEGGANYAETDDNISLVYMEEGVVFMPDGVYIVKGTPHLEQAQTFVDYMTGKNVQTYIAKVLNRRSVRNDVGIKPYLVSKDSVKEIRVDYKTAGDLKNDWLARFAEIWNSLQ